MVLESRETELKAIIATSQAERLDTVSLILMALPDDVSINTAQDGREELLSSWNVLKSSVATGQSELAQYTGSGGIDAKVRGLGLAQEAASRWTGRLLALPCQKARYVSQYNRESINCNPIHICEFLAASGRCPQARWNS
jgi:hypothetical protein